MVDGVWIPTPPRRKVRYQSYAPLANELEDDTDYPYSPSPDFDTLVRETPTRTPTVRADVTVPFLQSIGTGVLSSLFVDAVVTTAGGTHWQAIGLTSGVMTAVWLWAISDGRKLLRVVETIVNKDLDGDGVIGVANTKTDDDRGDRVVRMDITDRHPSHPNDPAQRYTTTLNLPEKIVNRLQEVSRAILNDKASFSRPSLATKLKILSQGEYETLRETMLRACLIRDEGNATVLTPSGTAFLKHWL